MFLLIILLKFLMSWQRKEARLSFESEDASPLSLDSLTITSKSNSCSSRRGSCTSNSSSLQLPILPPDPITSALSSQLKAVEEQVQAIHSASPDYLSKVNNGRLYDVDQHHHQHQHQLKCELNHKTRDQNDGANLMVCISLISLRFKS